jgi:predicted O-linked N-acetylglucosamine transferase (SPINDLY family)
LVELARRLGSCRFVFFEYRGGVWTQKLLQRLSRRFAQAGLDAGSYLELAPWAQVREFDARLDAADLMLDSIGFSGFNTVVHALSRGLPIVTQRGDYLRGRLGSGILEHIGIPDLVAATNEDYVERVEALVADAQLRQEMRRRIGAGRAQLYGDSSVVAALEDFLEVVGRQRA